MTCFSNHAASSLHRYWAATFPKDYEVNELSSEWLDTYKDEIDFVMHKFNDFLKRLVDFVNINQEYKLLVTSSMGQKATRAKIVHSELSVKDMDLFMKSLNMPKESYHVKPAMHPQYNVEIAESYIEDFKVALAKITIDGNPISYRQKSNTFFALDMGHTNLNNESIKSNGVVINPNTIGLENLKSDEEASGTAYHIPEGSLFVYDPKNIPVKKERLRNVDTRLIAPSILENFNIPVPDYMQKDRISAITH